VGAGGPRGGQGCHAGRRNQRLIFVRHSRQLGTFRTIIGPERESGEGDARFDCTGRHLEGPPGSTLAQHAIGVIKIKGFLGGLSGTLGGGPWGTKGGSRDAQGAAKGAQVAQNAIGVIKIKGVARGAEISDSFSCTTLDNWAHSGQ